MFSNNKFDKNDFLIDPFLFQSTRINTSVRMSAGQKLCIVDKYERQLLMGRFVKADESSETHVVTVAPYYPDTEVLIRLLPKSVSSSGRVFVKITMKVGRKELETEKGKEGIICRAFQFAANRIQDWLAQKWTNSDPRFTIYSLDDDAFITSLGSGIYNSLMEQMNVNEFKIVGPAPHQFQPTFSLVASK